MTRKPLTQRNIGINEEMNILLLVGEGDVGGAVKSIPVVLPDISWIFDDDDDTNDGEPHMMIFIEEILFCL